MGFLDNFMNSMRLNPEEGDYEDDDYGYEEEVVNIKDKKKFKDIDEDDFDDSPKKSAPAKKYQQPVKPVRKSSGNGMEVVLLKPTMFDNASEITDTLLSNRTVVLNLEGTDTQTAQRIIDFAYGSVYAIKGNMQAVSSGIFILTPATVDISGEDAELMSGGFGVPFRK